MMFRIILTSLFLLFWISPSQGQNNSAPLELTTISLKDLMPVLPEVFNTKQEQGVTEPTGKIFEFKGRRFQIRNFFFEDRRPEKNMEQTFGEYLAETHQENFLPKVFNQGYGPLCMYIIPDKERFCFLSIRPEPIHGYEDQYYPMVKHPIPASAIIEGHNYPLETLLQKFPTFAQSPASWLMSSIVGQKVTMEDGKIYQVRQAFFDDPLKKLEAGTTLDQFVQTQNLGKATTIAINHNNQVMEVFYRPSFDHEDQIGIYIAMAPL